MYIHHPLCVQRLWFWIEKKKNYCLLICHQILGPLRISSQHKITSDSFFFFTSFASRYWFDQVVLGSTQTIRFFSFVSCQQSFHWHLLILSALADYISVICFSLGTRSSAYFSSISSIRENETADSIEFWIFSSLQTKIFTLCDCKKKNSDLILPRCWIADAVLIDHHRPHSNHQYRRSPDAQLSSRFTRACSAHD